MPRKSKVREADEAYGEIMKRRKSSGAERIPRNSLKTE